MNLKWQFVKLMLKKRARCGTVVLVPYHRAVRQAVQFQVLAQVVQLTVLQVPVRVALRLTAVFQAQARHLLPQVQVALQALLTQAHHLQARAVLQVLPIQAHLVQAQFRREKYV